MKEAIKGRLGRNTRLVVFVSLALLLVGQAAFATFSPREPFPAIVMPGFGSSADNSDSFRATLLHIKVRFEDGTSTEPTFDQLMGDFRFSSARPSIDYMFHPGRNANASDPPPAVRTWLQQNANRLGEGSQATAVNFCWQPTDISLLDATTTPAEDCAETEVLF